MTDFQKFKQLYQDNKFDVLLRDPVSIYWLKLRSISRKELLVEFCGLIGIDSSTTSGSALFEYVYNAQPPIEKIDEFINQKYKSERLERKASEARLVSELYKMPVLDWGGLYQNNLERTIVDNYVKKIRNFDLLNQKIENEIHDSMRGYVQSSWYNHWTSILIEDIFKDHEAVTPTVGLIKKVDFFIGNVPFDLKVTYFPDGFMTDTRRAMGLPTELQALKRFARLNDIAYDRTQKDKIIFNELLTRISENHTDIAKNFMREFKTNRWDIVSKVLANHQNLIKWLYEEQGERRFDAANRLFLVLINKNNLEESWKMKRNVELLRDKINDYLDGFKNKNADSLKIDFNWIDGKQYYALSDIIFVVKE
ncbi:hypothetical protein COU91_01215 [Candidatus Saccharibacteria bacterium CG10_big_fil_rev_8_21_14_0_10_47_8]|nr:MAG: hypothetical protein COU91_01215 [Candidatus Saccharibacteria bacterium CG10_big_fil_rev_8_21_14_0_10_47_8]